MTVAGRGLAVVDTDVFSADLVPGSDLVERYVRLLAGRQWSISFQTEAEVRFGAIRRGWGDARVRRLERKLASVEIVHSEPELVLVCARLRRDCEAIGHALAQKQHNGDLWIAATAIWLVVPLIANDGIFRGVPGLVVETA